MAYPVSDLYKEAISKLSRTSYISGTLVLSDNTVIELSNETVSQGSFYITNQCVSSDSFSYGSVFAAEMGMTIKTEIDRYTLSGSYVLPYFSLKLSDDTYEKIPLGKFYVTEPNRVGRNITLKAYDGMMSLDIDIFENTTGIAFELLEWIALKCGIELAQTKEDIKLFPNTDVLLSVEADRVQTYRDLLSFICSITCTFAIFDREGKLKLVPYGSEVTKTIYARQRDSSKFSDFRTYFSAISGQFLDGGAYKLYSRTEEGDGLLYKVGDIPIVQGTELSNQAVLDNIFDKLSSVLYTPCDISFPGDPSIDLGDMIMNIDRQGNEIVSLVTFYKWTYRGKHQLKSAGSNPRMSESKSKSDKELENLVADVSLKNIAVYAYTNQRAYTVQGGGEDVRTLKEIVKISFAVNADVTSIITTTVCFNMNVQGCVEFGMYLDSVYQEGSTVGQICQAGPNTVTFVNYIPCEKGKTYRVSIFAKTYKLNEEDTLATATIARHAIKSVVFGQGIATQIPWDGTLTVEDILPDVISINARSITMSDVFIDTVEHKLYTPIRNGLADTFNKISIKKQIIKVENYQHKQAQSFTWADISSKTWNNMLVYSWGKEGE